ncbi:short transient receptor potential channel 4-like [Amphiura filiformis]|uniref:short transient receptor potential channel 4-like n=1 Tax=Amphiura filiformis TaxID=82378 RepID=UPI003B20BC19
MQEDEKPVISSSDEEDILEDNTRPNNIPLGSSHIFSATSPTIPIVGGLLLKLDEKQKLLFDAVEENDLERVRDLMCGESPTPDINGINQQRRSPLIVAIRAKLLDMIMLLLQCGAAVGDALLHAVESGSPAIVRLICTFLAPSKKALRTSIDGFALDTSFLPAATPLMYAAKENNHDMVKILVEHGAEIPTLEAVLSRTGEQTSYEFSLARLFWHQSISSEAYLLYATDDPVQAAFNAGRVIKKCEGEQLPHLKEGYNQLMRELDEFITKYLEMARNSGEISTLLCEEEPRAVPRNERLNTLPQRVQDALNLRYKQVIAHPNCMHFVLDQWYHPKWQDLSLFAFLLWTVLLVLAQPVFCICYVALPFKFVLRSMKTPYVRFLMHWSSRLSFIVCLMVVSIGPYTSDVDKSKCEEFKDRVTSPPGATMCLIYLWIVGLTWREIKEIYLQGIRGYCSDSFNIIDCLQMALYWASISTHILSYWVYTYEEEIYCPGMNFTTEAPVRTYQPLNRYQDKIGRNLTEYIISGSRRKSYEQIKRLNLTGPYDPLLLSGAAFSIATVLSFLSSLRDIVVLAFVGPLRVSLGGMITDIIRFVFLFFLCGCRLESG